MEPYSNTGSVQFHLFEDVLCPSRSIRIDRFSSIILITTQRATFSPPPSNQAKPAHPPASLQTLKASPTNHDPPAGSPRSHHHGPPTHNAGTPITKTSQS
ncbi:hypothetical protein P691DRAFT_122762 [Macrolepiota fuliginosa MF-IS2]|uniref:Uncharacterized protein n=1 Tax=Macrolepiota fuliginosa MF-IS2 TaxID=1400762 RepID=A0A9P5XAE7_9AGAR|nr:hypothetical protein P691DRAFT_122762 [Macrolepiota fuliginosa MF-IS2]